MKKIINKLIFIFALLPLLAGCEKDKEIVVVEPVENYTQLYGLGHYIQLGFQCPHRTEVD